MIATFPIALALLAAAPSPATAPPPPTGRAATAAPDPFDRLAPLMGRWIADDKASGSTGEFTLEKALLGNALVRRNRAEYAATKERPAFVHEDLMVISREGDALRARYWDSEGHVIDYQVLPEASRCVFLGDVKPGAPRFRLTYSWTDGRELGILFEVAPPGAPDQFKTYIQASVHR